MKFEEGQLAILNNLVIHGLPSRVGEVVEILKPIATPNYQYLVKLESDEIVPVREKELNEVTEEQLQLMTYIKRGNKVLYAPLNEKVEIKKIDLLHGHIEVEFENGKAMAVVGIEVLKPIEQGEEEIMEDKGKFQVGNKVRIMSQDKYNGMNGNVIDYIGGGEYGVQVDGKDLPFLEYELELITEEQNEKELHFELLFGHFEQEDGNYLVPKQLLHNLLNKIL